MDNIEYWIWLQKVLGAGSPKPGRLLAEFGGIDEVYNAEQGDYIKTGFLSQKEISRLCDKSLSKCEAIVDSCLKKGFSILSMNEIPQRLRDIYAPPCVLYVWGELPQNGDSLYIAMVGTRNVTAYGIEAATKISAGLANCGAVVVSGLAVGVDAASHKGTLKSGGKTVAVIGCGLNLNYPAVNSELKRLIAQNGAVISEYPPETRPVRANFPIRNRIIAGLSHGTVVVEAGKRSGALITATLAAEMGRDVFAVPGSIFSPMSDGTNSLLKDGAKPVCTIVDIIEEYVGLYPQNIIAQQEDKQREPEQLSFNVKNDTKLNKKTSNNPNLNMSAVSAENIKSEFKNATPRKNADDRLTANLPTASVLTAGAGSLSEKQLKVYNLLNETPQHVDDIALSANIEVRKVLAVLTTLEIEGYVKSYPGKRYTVLNKK